MRLKKKTTLTNGTMDDDDDDHLLLLCHRSDAELWFIMVEKAGNDDDVTLWKHRTSTRDVVNIPESAL